MAPEAEEATPEGNAVLMLAGFASTGASSSSAAAEKNARGEREGEVGKDKELTCGTHCMCVLSYLADMWVSPIETTSQTIK